VLALSRRNPTGRRGDDACAIEVELAALDCVDSAAGNALVVRDAAG